MIMLWDLSSFSSLSLLYRDLFLTCYGRIWNSFLLCLFLSSPCYNEFEPKHLSAKSLVREALLKDTDLSRSKAESAVACTCPGSSEKAALM